MYVVVSRTRKSIKKPLQFFFVAHIHFDNTGCPNFTYFENLKQALSNDIETTDVYNLNTYFGSQFKKVKIKIQYISTEDQLADIMTKDLKQNMCCYLRKLLLN